jgi:Predicted membrane protein (DUF2306)
MIRSFALTFAAATLRIYVPLSPAAGLNYDDSYPVVARLCWVPDRLADQHPVWSNTEMTLVSTIRLLTTWKIVSHSTAVM